jgi:hypothetical protein
LPRTGAAVEALPAHPEDWLIVAVIPKTPSHLEFVLKTLTPRFAQIIWTPGNHDLDAGQAADEAWGHYERGRLCAPPPRCSRRRTTT